MQLDIEIPIIRRNSCIALDLYTFRLQHVLLVAEQRTFITRMRRQCRRRQRRCRFARCVLRRIVGNGRTIRIRQVCPPAHSTSLLRTGVLVLICRLRRTKSSHRSFRRQDFRRKNFRRRSHSARVDTAERIRALCFLLIRQRAGAFLHKLEARQIAIRQVMRILQGDDILPRELIVAHEIPPHLCLHIQPLNRIPRVYIPARLQRDDMRIIRKHLERDRIAELAGLVTVHVEFEELIVCQFVAGDGIRAVFLEPGDDVRELEDEACVRAYGVLIGLERERAEVEGKPFEREVRLGLEAPVCAEAVGRRPLAVGDVELVGSCLSILDSH